MIGNEIKKIIHRREYLIIAGILITAVLLDFYSTCIQVYGENLSEIPSAYQMSILSNKSNLFDLVFGSFLFFLISNMIAVNIVTYEVECKIDTYIFTRLKAEKYIKNQVLAIVLVTFFTVWGCLLLSLGLSLSAFPLQGYFTEVTTHNTLMEPDPNRLFSYLLNFYPYLNILTLITLRALTAAVTAFFSSAIIIDNRTSKYVALFLPMVIFITYSITTSIIIEHIDDIGMFSTVGTYILSVNGAGSEFVIIGYLLIEVLVGVVLIKRGLKTDATIL